MKPRRALALLGTSFLLGSAFVLACSGDTPSDPPAPFDAAPHDAAPDTSAAPDAATPDLDAATGPFCTTIDASSVVLCDDFESTTAPLFGFDQRTLVGDAGSSLRISSEGGAENATLVLDVTLVQKADAGASAYLTKTLPGTGAPDSFLHYQVDLDVHVAGTTTLAYVALGGLQFPGGAIKEHGFAVYDGNVLARLVPKDLGVKDDKGKWHHVRIVLDRAAGSSPSSFATTIEVDATLIDNVGGVDPGATGGSMVRLGAFATSASASGSVRAQFDNVVIRRW